MPPEDPSVCKHLLPAPQAVFFRLLRCAINRSLSVDFESAVVLCPFRPELVGIFKSKHPNELLHPDALTPFITAGTALEQKLFNERTTQATQLLMDQVKAFADELRTLSESKPGQGT